MKKLILSAALAMTVFGGAWAATWDFSTVSSADAANLNADATNWTYESNNNRWLNKATLSAAPLTANGVELEFTKGLKVTTTGTDNVRVDAKKGSFTLNKNSAVITIPGLKAGDVVKIDAGSSSSGTARNLVATNLTITSGFEASTDRGISQGTVTADGDVTIKSTGGFYVYSIEAGDGSTGGGGGNVTTPDHSTGMNPMANQMAFTMANNAVKYYNTADLREVSINKANGLVTVTPKAADWNDEFAANVNAISFSKAPETGSEADITNAGVNITEAKGWLESCYAKWDLMTGATSYNVYVKGGKYTDWTKIDRELVRNYGTYGRADMPGLPAGKYSLKVVPVVGGNEDAASASVAADMTVRAHDRSGFAFLRHTGTGAYDGSGIGAYKENGELKDNATVIYVTAATAKTVTATIFHDKEYKQFTGLQAIMDALQKGTAKEPVCVRVIGTIKDSDMDSFSSSAEGLQVKGKNDYSPVNVTFEGIGDDAGVWGFGFLIRNCHSVEFNNLAIMLCLDDALSFDTSNSHCWVHNMDFFYGNTGGDSDQAKGDGTVDLKAHTRYITIAYNHFWDSGKTSLCGMGKESQEDYADYHHNWFDHSDSRHPRVRTITTHVWNNYYDGVAKYGVGATMGCSIFVENNFYRHTNDPMLSSKQGTDAKGSGTFSGEDGGVIKSFGNLYAEKGSSSNYTAITYQTNATSFDCYEAATRDEQVPASVKALQGGTGYNNFDTSSTLMHTYTPIAAIDVPAAVTGYYGAGRLNKGDFSYNLNYTNADTDYAVIKGLKTALQNYKSSFVGIF